MKERYKENKNLEKLPDLESHEHNEQQTSHERAEVNHSKEKEHRIEKAEEKLEQSLADNKEDVNPLEKLENIEKDQAKKNENIPISKELYNITTQRALVRIQKSLPYAQRNFSKVIHTPIIKDVSEVASKTVGRTSGLLGGGIAAFLGTTIYLYTANHTGFRYNYMVSILLAISGFFIGIFIEFIVNKLSLRHTS